MVVVTTHRNGASSWVRGMGSDVVPMSFSLEIHSVAVGGEDGGASLLVSRCLCSWR